MKIVPKKLLEDKEETMSTDTDDVEMLQDRLIEYCAQKSDRAQHLRHLQHRGALNTEARYDTVKTIILNYLIDPNINICKDGASRAKECLGLKEERWVEKTMQVNDVLELDDEKVRVPLKGGAGGVVHINLDKHISSHRLRDSFGSRLPYGMRIVVEVLEES